MPPELRKATLHCATCLSAFAAWTSPALARDAAADMPACTDSPQKDACADDATSIIVTGSRFARPELETPNPVTTVTAQAIAQSGTVNLTDYLTKTPALSGSITAFDTSGNRAGIGTTGLNLLALHNLGVDRTLVLIDGRRQVSSIAGSQAVDINTIPQDLIERIEVMTGGASAIYGADGVAGVVNIIQKTDFEGLTAHAQSGISSHGDAGQRLISLTAGHTFAQGRANITLAFEHGEEDRLSAQQRRRYSGTNAVSFQHNPADTEVPGGPNDGIPDTIPYTDIRYFDTSREGAIDVNFDGMPDFYGAQGTPFDHGHFVPNTFQQGGSGTLASDYANDLRPQIRRDLVDAMAHFDISPALTLYAQGKFARTRSLTYGQPTYDYNLFIPADNPFIPTQVRPFINPQAGGVLVNRDNFDFGRRGEDITRRTVRSVLGAKGEIAPGLSYDLSWVYGRTTTTNHYINNILSDRFYAAIDAVNDGKGGVTCRANTMAGWTPFQPIASGRGTRPVIPPTTFAAGECIPLDLFGQNLAANRAAIDWIRADTTDHSTITQNVVNGALNGDTGAWFMLPGGPVRYAIGGEYRRETSRFTADPIASQRLTFANALGNTAGRYDVWALFAEANLPLLKDVPFAHRLDVDAAYRHSDYSTVGATSTWNLGANWSPIADITIRGTYSRAMRAPNISELYSASSQIFQPLNDPCSAMFVQNGTASRASNCRILLSSLGVSDPASWNNTPSGGVAGTASGNPDLREETARTWTAGLVLQPRIAPGLTLTADWHDIRIDHAINTIDPQTLVNLCVDQPSLANPFCASVTRQNGGATPGIITGFVAQPLNVATFHTSGLDVTVDYHIQTDALGQFGIRVQAGYLHRLGYVPMPGAVRVDQTRQPGSPRYQANTDLHWQRGKVALNWRINYASAVYRFDNQTMAANPDIVAPQYRKFNRLFSHDIFASVAVNTRFELYGGVNNLFNQQPSLGTLNQPISAVGRYMFVGARVALANLFGGSR